jgi:hypothetical protein
MPPQLVVAELVIGAVIAARTTTSITTAPSAAAGEVGDTRELSCRFLGCLEVCLCSAHGLLGGLLFSVSLLLELVQGRLGIIDLLWVPNLHGRDRIPCFGNLAQDRRSLLHLFIVDRLQIGRASILAESLTAVAAAGEPRREHKANKQ